LEMPFTGTFVFHGGEKCCYHYTINGLIYTKNIVTRFKIQFVSSYGSYDS